MTSTCVKKTMIMRARANLFSGVGPLPVSPSPEVREKIKEELNTLHGSVTPFFGTMLRLKTSTPIGMNDGLIRPGDTFPIGTAPDVIRNAALERAPLRGTIRVVVVLVEFGDRSLGQPQEHYESLFFSSNVLPNGSVAEYFKEVSNGLVNIVGEVAGPYKLPKTLKQYANGESGCGFMQPNARTMARDAAEAANRDVDFSLYDNDRDNYVDAFVVLHAGQGAETTASEDDIWSHKWVLTGGHYDADGARIFAYLTVPEDSKIGVCCHELGHLLFGLPDLYDTDYSSEGVGNWCLMGGGSWLGGGEVPAHLSAWGKLQQGWVTVEEPVNNPEIQIPAVEEEHVLLKLWRNGASRKEYFLIENRQKILYDRNLPSEGLLIWHIDDSISTNSDEIHPKVALLQADGSKDLEKGNNRGDTGDPYPGISNNKTLDSASIPSSLSYSGMDTCVKISNISTSKTIMTADVFTQCETKPEISLWEKLKEILFGRA